MAVKDNVALKTGLPVANTNLLQAIIYAFEKISNLRKETVIEDDYENCDEAATEIATNILKNIGQYNRTVSNPTSNTAGMMAVDDITPEIREMIYRDKIRIIATSANTDIADKTKFILDNEVE